MTKKAGPPPMESPEKETKQDLSPPKKNKKGFSKPTGEFTPPRIILNAVEGFGKTTIGSYSPSPAFIMARGETGYSTLVGVDLAPKVDCVVAETWQETMDLVDEVGDHDTIVFDALGGFERLCHEHIWKTYFKSDWELFNNYHKGQERAIPEWIKLLSKLEQTGKMVIFLSHSIIKTFQDPLGPDYDRYRVDCHKYTWSVTHKWCDTVLFGVFRSIVDTKGDKKKLKGKGIGGSGRVIFTQHHDAYDAKNRYNMPEEIDLTNDPAESWGLIWKHIHPKKKK